MSPVSLNTFADEQMTALLMTSKMYGLESDDVYGGARVFEFRQNIFICYQYFRKSIQLL